MLCRYVRTQAPQAVVCEPKIGDESDNPPEPGDLEQGYEFGSSLALAGTTAVIGAPYASSLNDGLFHGAAYVFDLVGGVWEENTKLNPSTNDKTTSLDRCGTSVALAGDYALVGCPYDDTNGKYIAFPHSFVLVRSL